MAADVRYLDHAATAPVRREVLEAMWPFLTGNFGNPSSHHGIGERAARALADARGRVAQWLDVRPAEITFTSGGTEADNCVVKGLALAAPRGRQIVISAIEHPAVVESCAYLERYHGFSTSVLPVDAYGVVDLTAAEQAIGPETALVSVMLANNEIGTIEPVAALARIARRHGVPVHTDAVQAAGAIDCRPGVLGVDAMSVSGHKLGTPKGIGVLFVRRGVRCEPLVHGGGQERGRRSGTENVAGAVGLARAAGLLETERFASRQALCVARDRFIAEVLRNVPAALLTGHASSRLPGHASFCFPGTAGEAVLLRLEQEHGIVCSSGSACAAGSDEPSPVLLATGLEPEVARTAVRFTSDDPMSFDEVAVAIAETVRLLGGV